MVSFDNDLENLFINECLQKVHKIKYGDGSATNEAIQRIIAEGNKTMRIGSVHSSAYPSMI